MSVGSSRFEGRLVMVSGGGNGIGAACARRFAAEGARLAVIDRDGDGLAEVFAGFDQDRIVCETGDCTDDGTLRGFYERATARFGPVDVLFNNVGQSGRARSALFHASDEEVWRFVLEVSLLTTMRLSRLVAPTMRERGGRIVNMSSDAALSGDAGLADYAAAKMGVIGTRAHDEVPAEVIDRIKRDTPAGFIGTPDDVAAAVAFLASDEARFITGQTLLIDGGRWMV